MPNVTLLHILNYQHFKFFILSISNMQQFDHSFSLNRRLTVLTSNLFTVSLFEHLHNFNVHQTLFSALFKKHNFFQELIVQMKNKRTTGNENMLRIRFIVSALDG
jgi:hypothetical protein